MIDRLSIEPSRYCSKACVFCYNQSGRAGGEGWKASEVVSLIRDCARHGLRYLSIGGGEPLEWSGLFDTLSALRGVVFRSFTTNGLPFESSPELFQRCADAGAEKVHISIHSPERSVEVHRVLEQLQELWRHKVPAGVNLLVKRSTLNSARSAVGILKDGGLKEAQLMLLPCRIVPGETPSPRELASAATPFGARPRFQSTSCLTACGRSARFASIAADRTVAWCSYTTSRSPLLSLSYQGLVRALQLDADSPLALRPCGPRSEDERAVG